MLLLCLAIVAQWNCSINDRFGVGSIAVVVVVVVVVVVDVVESIESNRSV